MFGPSPTPLDPARHYGDALPALLRNPRAELEAGFLKLKVVLAKESAQSKEMMEIYARAGAGKATREDIARANGQMMDLLRLAGMGTFFAVIPGSVLLLPMAVAAASKLGIRLLPDAWEEQQGGASSGQT